MERIHLDTEHLWLWVDCSCLAATACLTRVTTSYLGWVDHSGDGGQVYMEGLPDVPAGMRLRCRLPYRLPVQARWPWLAQTLIADVRKPGAKSRDTSGPGHDWIIEGTLAGVIQQTDLLLATRNVTGARAFMPISKEVTDFTETQRVQRNSVLTGGGDAELFYANRERTPFRSYQRINREASIPFWLGSSKTTHLRAQRTVVRETTPRRTRVDQQGQQHCQSQFLDIAAAFVTGLPDSVFGANILSLQGVDLVGGLGLANRRNGS